jgi:putative DNA methylase
MIPRHAVKTPKKLIEVALPLDAINVAAAREKSIRHGHPSTLHLWWARRPLAAARAVIFGQMVNDPSWKWEMEHPEETPPNNLKASWAASRKRLFNIIEDLVQWENTTNEEVVERARAEIRKSWRETCELNKEHPQAAKLFNPDNLPAFHDPFAGGGALPLEAQRLGLEAYASDLNPVAVLINKAMIEIPPRFAGQAPINPESRSRRDLIERGWKGAQGLAEDVRYYGQWVRDEAQKRIGHLYPPVEITADMAQDRPDLTPLIGHKLTVIAWLWARTVKSPNPAFAHVDVPLTSTFILSTKAEKDAYVEPAKDGDSYRFTVRLGKSSDPERAKHGTKLSRGANFRCLMSDTPMSPDYIKSQGMAGRMGTRLMAIVAEGPRGRVFLSPTEDQETIARCAAPTDVPTQELPLNDTANFWCALYGLTRFVHLFTPRQLVALTTLSDLVQEAREKVKRDALQAGLVDDVTGFDAGGAGAAAYGDGLGVYLGFLVNQVANHSSSVCGWNSANTQMRSVFARQAIPMMWDYAESNPLCDSSGSYSNLFERQIKGFSALGLGTPGHASQVDANSQTISTGKVISTDPPYYDNIGYADLSDFFYVWLRRGLKPLFPDLFATLAVPKAEELVAAPHRHGGQEKAEAFFLAGMTQAMHRLAEQAHPAFPVTVYYAFKQSETENVTDGGTASTGWDTFLEALIHAGFSIGGTWPIRTEKLGRVIGNDTNALASSIVLVCRPRAGTAASISRRAFLRELNVVLPQALDEMTKGSGEDQSPVAPVDLSQAIIGPGMAVFSKYAAVLEADGTSMSVRTALQLINRFLAEDDFDHDTQFCLHWFEQHGWKEGKFGDADTLARAKGTSVDGVKQAGVLYAAGGVVRLLKWADYPSDWDPKTDPRLPVWEALHQTIRVFKTEGETTAGVVLAAIQGKAEATRQLAYRLYTLCERAGWAEDARAYNEIITSWSAIEAAAAAAPTPQQTTLFG